MNINIDIDAAQVQEWLQIGWTFFLANWYWFLAGSYIPGIPATRWVHRVDIGVSGMEMLPCPPLLFFIFSPVIVAFAIVYFITQFAGKVLHVFIRVPLRIINNWFIIKPTKPTSEPLRASNSKDGELTRAQKIRAIVECFPVEDPNVIRALEELERKYREIDQEIGQEKDNGSDSSN